MERILLLLVCCLPCWVQTVSAYTWQPIPKWVEPVQYTLLSPQRPGQPIIYHLVNHQSRYTESGDYTYYSQYVQTAQNINGVNEIGSLQLRYRQPYQSIVIHHLEIIRDGQRINKLPSAQIDEVSIEPESDQNLYNGIKAINILLTDIRIGDTLDYAVSYQGRNPVYAHLQTESFHLGWSIPAEKLFTRFVTPQNSPFAYRQFQSTYAVQQQDTLWGHEYRIEAAQTPAIQYEQDVPTGITQFPFIQFSNAVSWQQVAQWSAQLFQYDDRKMGRHWQHWQQQVAQQPTAEAKILKALALVQTDIRYVGIELGENSHRPHTPNDTIEQRFGDCKDKTLLLVSLLAANGIAAKPALVSLNTQQGIAQLLPTPDAFDHVIAHVQLGERTFWLDGTKTHQAGAQLETLGYSDLGYALLASTESGALTPMPKEQAQASRIDYIQRFYVSGYLAPVLMEIESQYSGNEAERIRYQFSSQTHPSIAQSYLSYYRKTYERVDPISTLVIEDDSVQNQFRVNERYLITDFFKPKNEDSPGDTLYYSAWSAEINSYLSLPDDLTRQHPYALHRPVQIIHRIEVYYPDYFSFNDSLIDLSNQDEYR